MYRSIVKRFFDLIFSVIGLVILSPLFLIVMILLFIVNGGKPFFMQPRPGKDEKIFKIIKFKTMTDKTNAEGQLLDDKERLTPVGKFVRKSSIDELPQLLNVIWGDMSLVGPRPLLIAYLGLYNQEQKRRHQVRPGITGWAQVNGRNTISWNQKFVYDVWYVDNLSFGLDLKILFMTLLKVLKARDINTKGHATTTPFTGKN